MPEEPVETDAADYVPEHASDLAAVLRTLAHPVRLRVLTALLPAPQPFYQLLADTGLKKSALANHLTLLVEHGLIEKVHHGMYAVTADGAAYLGTLATVHQQSAAGRRARAEALRRYELARAFFNRPRS